MNVHERFIYKSQKLETTKCPLVREWLNKQVYPHHGTLHDSKKE